MFQEKVIVIVDPIIDFGIMVVNQNLQVRGIGLFSMVLTVEEN